MPHSALIIVALFHVFSEAEVVWLVMSALRPRAGTLEKSLAD